MARRKTLPVAHVVAFANAMLMHSVASEESRKGIMALTENILHGTGNYQGFRYLDKNEVPTGHKPGIHYGPGGVMLDYPERFNDTDNTRVHYFCKD